MNIKNYQKFNEKIEQIEQVFSDLDLSFKQTKSYEWKVWYPNKNFYHEIIDNDSFITILRYENNIFTGNYNTFNLKNSLIGEYIQYGLDPKLKKEFERSELENILDNLPDKLKIPFIIGDISLDSIDDITSLSQFGLFEKSISSSSM